MAIRRYTITDKNLTLTRDHPRVDSDLSLLDLHDMTDFREEEFDHVASMQIDETYVIDNGAIEIKRTA